MSILSNLGVRTQLNDKQYNHCWKLVERFLQKNGSIRNREFREITTLGYDQAINFFKRATTEKRLIREGTSSATRYVLPKH